MVFEYSFWWIIPFIGVALVVAWSKFRKLSKLPDISKGIALLISCLRFCIIFILLFLLLNPALSLLRKTKEKPILVIAQDNSSSLIKNKDSLFYLNEYKESLEHSCQLLEDKFEIIRLTFGNTVRQNNAIDFTEHYTDLSALFDYVGQNFIVRRPQAMLLLTDGIYNRGVNPRYKIPDFPVYTVALGDTISYPDVYIRNLETDKFNFVNTIFPLKVEIAAIKQNGNILKCILKENGKVLDIRTLTIDQDNYLKELEFNIEAKRKGIFHYSIALETDSQEHTSENNKAETWVNILDNSANVALYTSAPHPDIAAITNAINVSGVYKCKLYRWEESLDSLKANLVIIHNPDVGNAAYQQLIKEVNQRKLSVWYILTTSKSIAAFSQVHHLYVADMNGQTEYATVQVNPAFPYFEFSESEITAYQQYPPLIVPFGEINTGAGRTLLTQKIKNTPTSNGILGFYEVNSQKISYFWGEGLWRWRLYSYEENGNHELFNTLINKTVGYLTTRQGTERLIHDVKPLYEDAEEALINVELYNNSYELVNSPEVKLDLKWGEKEFNYLFNRNGEKYRLNLGNLPAGEYAFKITTDLKGERFSKSGIFYVKNQNPELNNLVANQQLLKEIAFHSKGEIAEVQELEKIIKNLDSNDKYKPVYKSEMDFIDLRGLEILGLIILLLLCIEWFLLKFFAG